MNQATATRRAALLPQHRLKTTRLTDTHVPRPNVVIPANAGIRAQNRLQALILAAEFAAARQRSDKNCQSEKVLVGICEHHERIFDENKTRTIHKVKQIQRLKEFEAIRFRLWHGYCLM